MKLTIIDLSSIFWRNWHATAPEELSMAHSNTLRHVYKFVNDAEPVAICIDCPPYKRKEIFAGYKAHRDTPDNLALEQLERVKEALRKDGFPVLGQEGYEADDIIASIVLNSVSKCNDITIVTGDKDLAQLVSDADGVRIKSTQTGDIIDESAVKQKFGLPPTRVAEYLALVGDKSDNVPGVHGVGPKRAVELLKERHVIEIIHIASGGDHEELFSPPSVRKALIENWNQLSMSLRLVELMDDAEINMEEILKPREPVKYEDEQEVEFEEKPSVELKKPTSIVRAAGQWSTQLEPCSTKDAWNTAKVLFDSRLYQNFRSPEQVFATIMRGRELGLGATTSLDSFHVIQGRPTMSAQLMVGLVLRSGKADYFKLVESTTELSTYKTHRKDDPDPDATVLSFTIGDAKEMGLVGKDNWKKQPANMLRWRAAARLARAVYPDIVAGLYTPDEISDGEVVECEVVG